MSCRRTAVLLAVVGGGAVSRDPQLAALELTLARAETDAIGRAVVTTGRVGAASISSTVAAVVRVCERIQNV